LTEQVELPERAKVNVIVPDREDKIYKIMSPRLVVKEDVAEFKKKVRDAKVQ
jgi:hypothetical protein